MPPGPVMDVGEGFTVSCFVDTTVPQLFETEKEIVPVPGESPATLPDVPIAAIDGAEQDHVPGPTGLVSITELPSQTVPDPKMAPAFGKARTVTNIEEPTVPQMLLTR
jgi:hypothetical protein